MSLSFEQRQEEVHDAILRGDIGCPFGTQAAREELIDYCAIPRDINVERIPRDYIDALVSFSRHKTATVLIGLPQEDSPRDAVACRKYAHELFPETVSSMQYATQNILDHLFAEESMDELEPELYELLQMNPQASRYELFDFWRKNAHLLSETPAGGSAAAYLLRYKTQAMEQMFTFTMDPSYPALQGKRHPRFSPHFALLINYREDLQGLGATAPSTYAATKQWMNSVVGYDYIQGFRIEETPAPSDEARRRWKPID